MKTRTYTVVIERGRGGTWGAWIPDLPGCAAVGDTRVEAETLVAEAAALHIESLRENGRRIPAHRTLASEVAILAPA
jgi:predicted RNase H-like HicB family nuclease